jgi:hypothetical protein
MSNQQMIQSDAMPKQIVPAYPANSNSPMSAGLVKQQQQAELQNSLAKTGGYRRRRTYTKGGAVIQVPPVPAGTISPAATGGNYKGITELAQQQSSQAVYDNSTSPSQTAAIAAQQQSQNKTGGSRRGKRGGSFTRWGCFSGGKKYSRKGNCKRKSRRTKRKSCKVTKRHRH